MIEEKETYYKLYFWDGAEFKKLEEESKHIQYKNDLRRANEEAQKKANEISREVLVVEFDFDLEESWKAISKVISIFRPEEKGE